MTTTKIKKKTKKTSRALWLSGSLLGLAVATPAWLMLTETGTSVLVTGLTRVLPMMTVGSVAGTLSDLKLTDFRLATEGFSLQADETEAKLSLRALLSGEVRLKRLDVKGLTIAVTDTGNDEPEADIEKNTRLALPVDIVAETVHAQDVSFSINGTTLTLARFQGAYDWRGDSMRLIEPNLTDFTITTVADDSPADAKASSGDLGIRETLTALQTEALFTLPVFDEEGPLTFNLALENFSLNRLDIVEKTLKDGASDTLFTAADIALTADLTGPLLSIKHFETRTSIAELPAVKANGSLSMTDVWRTELTLDAQTAIDALPLGDTHLTLTGELARQITLQADTRGELKTKLHFDWSPAVPGIPGHLDLLLLTPKVLLNPESPTDRLTMGTGTLRLEGDAKSWTLNGFGTVERANLPATLLTVSGQGYPEGAALSNLQLRSRSGTAHFQGDVTWHDILRWRGRAGVTGLDLTDFIDVPAKDLTGTAAITGHWRSADDWQNELCDFSLTGRVHEKDLSLKGAVIAKDHYRLYAPKVSLTLGNNRADFLAKFDKPIFEADLKIDAPTLEDIDPLLKGSLKGSVLLRGNPENPLFVANIAGSALAYGDTNIESATLAGTIKPDRHGTVGGKLAFVAKKLTDNRVPEFNTKVIALVLDGTEKNHTLKLGMQGKPLAAGLRFEGALNRQTFDWTGRLAAARLSTPTGLWSQEKPAKLSFSAKSGTVTLAPHAWTHPDARLRFTSPLILGATGHVALALERLGLPIFDTYLPEGTKLTGDVAGDADIHWYADEKRTPTVTLNLKSRDLSVHREVRRSDGGDTARLSLPVENLELTAGLTRDNARFGWSALLGGSDQVIEKNSTKIPSGRFAGHLTVDDPMGDKRLSGNAAIESLDMSFLNTFFVTGEHAEGIASGQLTAGGTLLSPELHGYLNITGLRVTDGMTPVEMAPSDIGLLFNGMTSSLAASLRTDKGELTLAGTADWQDIDNPFAEVHAKTEKGSDLFFSLPPYVKVRLAPDVYARAQKDKLILGGVIDIPFAKIHVTELPPSTVGVSRDEVMLTDKLVPIMPKSASIPIESQLRIRLGDRVKVDAFGFKTKLTGTVDVLQTKRGLGLTGQLDLKNGRFKAYGQDLQVEDGSVIFAGPVDRPTLNISAIRNPEKTEDEVVAGLKVTGTADSPRVEVFSRPAMPREEALAYLLRGHGVDTTDDENNNAVLTSALIGIGISQTGNMIGSIGNTFGIRDLGVDTTGTGDSSQVVVSGYVLPRLQVKYGVGLFDSLSTLTLRYRLMPKLFLESVSGVNQSVDLLYKFEF